MGFFSLLFINDGFFCIALIDIETDLTLIRLDHQLFLVPWEYKLSTKARKLDSVFVTYVLVNNSKFMETLSKKFKISNYKRLTFWGSKYIITDERYT